MTPPPSFRTLEPRVLIANLPDGGELAYLDSGPVQNSNDFSTLVLLHGMNFNAHGFEHLLPLAHSYNLRLVAPQRKDYAGSSKYTDAEIAALSENPRAFFEGAGRTLAQFIFYLIKETRVCKPNEDYSRGGVAVAGWSFGAIHAMAMFGRRGTLDSDDSTYSGILPYVTSLILYDPPYNNFGMRFPVVTVPPGATYDDIKEPFQLLASSYYDHPAHWDRQLSSLDMRGRTDHCTLTSWTRAQRERWTEDFPMRSELPVITKPVTQSYLEELTTEVIFDFDARSCPFPRARITYLHAKQTMWQCVVARYKIWDKQVAFLRQGSEASLRPVGFKDVECGNHFIHYDYPQEFMAIMRDCVSHWDRLCRAKDEVYGVPRFFSGVQTWFHAARLMWYEKIDSIRNIKTLLVESP